MSKRLLIRPGGIGDCIVTFPAIRSLLQPETELWISAPCVSLARPFCPTQSLAEVGFPLLGYVSGGIVDRLKERLAEFSQVIAWYPYDTREIDQLSQYSQNLTVLRCNPPEESGLHAIDFHLDQIAKRLGVGPADAQTSAASVDDSETTFIALQPFASSKSREWPLSYYLALESRIFDLAPVKWIVDPCRLPLAIRPRGEIVAESDLSVVAARLRQAAVYVGGDTGVSHLAAYMGTPVVALFASQNPQIWAPRGAGRTSVLQCTSGLVQDIALDEVVSATRSLFRGALIS